MLAGYLPALGLLSIGTIAGLCWNCQFSSPKLSTLAPIIGLTYLGYGLVLFTFPLVRQKVAFVVFLLWSALVPVTQAWMLVSEPKLCPACLLFTFVAASYFAACLEVMTQSALTGMKVPRPIQLTILVVFCCIIVRHALNLSGKIVSVVPGNTEATMITGRPLNRYILSMKTPKPGMLYIVGKDNCEACMQAEKDLPKMGVSWQKFSPCTTAQESGCFNATGMTFAMPMLFACNSKGLIVYQSEGWDKSTIFRNEVKGQIERSAKAK